MKKYLFGVIAIVLATASVAFTKPKHAVVTGTYWFPTNASGVLQSYIKADNMPYTSPQLGCAGSGTPCEEVNNDYTATPVTGGFRIAPAGTDQPATLKRHN